MVKPSDARNFPRLPVTYSDLDKRTSQNSLPIWVSGVKARAYIGNLGEGYYSSTRIWIRFEEPHSLMGERFNPTEDSEHGEFVTKYFHIDSPGHLVWGKMDENLWILEHRK
uniref:Uncharacterized protein n=1 Tax=uncultured marine group II/III euryarchaeote KM3_27_D07 TaxID=1456429 RepID=A0A075H0V9_9EURY|nr:hypothetical protein [uncultured marine group II/III euryarchaeote KM3_27_D07]